MGEQRLSPSQILRLAQQVIDEFFSGGDATRFPFPSVLMLAAIAWIESHGDFYAERAEPHLQDCSVGLCQLLTSTAGWLAEDMGYRAFGPSVSKSQMQLPKVSLYFAGAYTQHLSRHFRSHAFQSSVPVFSELRQKAFEEQFVVRGYNGGPQGYKRTATQHYWSKYQEAKAFMAEELAKMNVGSSKRGADSQVQVHVVQNGDTMWKLSQEYDCTVASLIELNPDIVSPDLLYVGNRLNVPAGRRETMLGGETSGALESKTPASQIKVQSPEASGKKETVVRILSPSTETMRTPGESDAVAFQAHGSEPLDTNTRPPGKSRPHKGSSREPPPEGWWAAIGVFFAAVAIQQILASRKKPQRRH